MRVFTHSRCSGRLAVFLTVVSVVVLVDQATKAAVRYIAPVGTQARSLIPGLVDLWHIENTGAAFSLGEGAAPVFVLLALAVLVASLILITKQALPFFLVISLACVAGGGVGNMVDRLVSGSVTDFLSLVFINFPVFNVADMFVTVGVIVTFIGYITWDRKRQAVLTTSNEDH